MVRMALAGVALALAAWSAPAAAQEAAAPVLPLDGPEAKAVRAFLDELGATFEAGDGRKVVAKFDLDRFVGAIASQLPPAQAAVVRQPGFRMGFELGLSRQFTTMAAHWSWERCELRRLESHPDGVWVAYVREWDKQGTADLQRWWLARSGANLRVVDTEPVMVGLRLSQESAAAVPAALGADGASIQALKTFNEATVAFGGGDRDRMAELLALIPEGALPGAFESVRWLMLAAVAVDNHETEPALAHVARARQFKADMPVVDLVEARARLQREAWAEADALAERFLARVGADPDGLAVRGMAAEGRGDTAAAARHFRAGLDDDPSASDCLVGLARVLPEGQKAELGERFKRFADPTASFEAIAAELVDAEDLAGLQAVVEAYRTLAPADPNCDYYGAHVLLGRKKPAEAAAMLERAMDRAPDEEREAYWSAYLDAMVQAGKGLEGYRRIPDAELAFRQVADHLASLESWDPLAALLAAHRERVPADPWHHFYEGRLRHARGAASEAEQAYLRAHELLGDEAPLEPLTELRVAAGRWKDAYAGPASPGQMFPVVAQALHDAKQGAALVELCALHEKAAPADRSVPIWRADGWALQGEHGRALKALEPHRAKLEVDGDYVWWFESRWIRSLARLKRFDEALEAAKRSTARDGDAWYEVVVAALRGDAAGTAALLRVERKKGRTVAEMWNDEDVAEVLRSAPFAKVREEFPPPEGK